jgi:hypothetical protein
VVLKVTPGWTKKKKKKKGDQSAHVTHRCQEEVVAGYQFHQAREAPLMWQMTM